MEIQPISVMYKETWEKFNENGRKIYSLEKKSEHPCLSIQGCRYISEYIYVYNNVGDLIQIKYQKWSEDKNGNIIAGSDDSHFHINPYEIVMRVKSNIYVTNYLYDYEYYDDRKLKKKTCYRY